jgi:hypothetical protein
MPLSPADSSSRTGLAVVAGAALACTLFASPIHAAPQREQLTIAPEEMMTPWTGDLDGMIARRVIRVLTVYSKTFYFGQGSARDLRHLSAVRDGSEQEAGQEQALKQSTSRSAWCYSGPPRRLLQALAAQG